MAVLFRDVCYPNFELFFFLLGSSSYPLLSARVYIYVLSALLAALNLAQFPGHTAWVSVGATVAISSSTANEDVRLMDTALFSLVFLSLLLPFCFCRISRSVEACGGDGNIKQEREGGWHEKQK